MDIDIETDPALLVRQIFLDEARGHLAAIINDLVTLPAKRANLEEVLRRVHTLKGTAGTANFGAVGEAAHRIECHLSQLLPRLAQGEISEAFVDALLAVVDRFAELLDGQEAGSDPSPLHQRLDRALDLLHLEANSKVGARRRSPRPSFVWEALDAEDSGRLNGDDRRPEQGRRREDFSRIRISAKRMQQLSTVASQLIADRVKLEQDVSDLRALCESMSQLQGVLRGRAESAEGNGLAHLVRQAARITADLEQLGDALSARSQALCSDVEQLNELLARLRVLPLRRLFLPLGRPVREMARGEGKLVRLATSTQDVELDRSIVEPVFSILVHLLRNAIAHGIEAPAERLEQGKPEEGTIRLVASHEGDLVQIEVEDDGRGIDEQLVRSIADEYGQHQRCGAQSEGKLIETLAAPGFSTRDGADFMAGRGLGLDIVRRELSVLGGRLQLNSTPGLGTTVVLLLPLAAPTIQTVVVEIGSQCFALPAAAVLETIELGRETSKKAEDGTLRVKAKCGWLPVLDLHRTGLIESAGTAYPWSVVVLGSGSSRFGLACKRVVGPREASIHRLGPPLSRVPLIAGATVGEAGDVRFVLDVQYLAKLWRHPPWSRTAASRQGDAAGSARCRILVALREGSEALGEAFADPAWLVQWETDGWRAWQGMLENDYDLLLTELYLPKMQGYELVRKCRQEPRTATTPIIVLGPANGQVPKPEVARRTACDRYVCWPDGPRGVSELESVVRALLAQRGDSAQHLE
jgi:chemotaxis protein histidine kinase CheA/CheY-like chemotaxis protein